MENKKRENERGFTLAEVVVAVVVLVVALVPLIIVFGESAKRTKDPQKITVAGMLAQDLMEEIIAKRFDEDPANPDSPLNLRPETGETRSGTPPNNNYDDVDDYNNYTETPPSEVNGTLMNEYTGFTRTVVVDYVQEANFDVVSAVITRFKRVRLTITWENGAQNFEIEAIKGNY